MALSDLRVCQLMHRFFAANCVTPDLQRPFPPFPHGWRRFSLGSAHDRAQWLRACRYERYFALVECRSKSRLAKHDRVFPEGLSCAVKTAGSED
jgi:hypothetical protein